MQSKTMPSQVQSPSAIARLFKTFNDGFHPRLAIHLSFYRTGTLVLPLLVPIVNLSSRLADRKPDVPNDAATSIDEKSDQEIPCSS